MAGFVQRLYPASGNDAAKIQGDAVSIKDPVSGQTMVWDDYTKQWVPQELISTAYSITAPASPSEGMRWVDTTTLREYEYYSGAWVEVGSVPAVVSPASESVAGVVELATDAETQTGTDTSRVPPVSALAAWWTWIKTQAQTFAGNLTLNGTLSTAPNQTAASGSAILTRDLGDVRYGGANFWSVLSADIVYQNNNTASKVSDWEVSLTAGVKYYVEIFWSATYTTASGFAYSLFYTGVVPAAARLEHRFNANSAGVFFSRSAYTSNNNIIGYFINGAAGEGGAIFRGVLIPSSSGTLTARASQYASHADLTKLVSGSYFRVVTLP